MKRTWPIATATRCVTDLALVDMRWISDEGVRCGSDDVADAVEVKGVDSAGGVLTNVVEIARTVVLGWSMLDRRCNGMGRGVFVNPTVTVFRLLSLFVNCVGQGERCVGQGERCDDIGRVLSGGLSELSKVSDSKTLS